MPSSAWLKHAFGHRHINLWAIGRWCCIHIVTVYAGWWGLVIALKADVKHHLFGTSSRELNLAPLWMIISYHFHEKPLMPSYKLYMLYDFQMQKNITNSKNAPSYLTYKQFNIQEILEYIVILRLSYFYLRRAILCHCVLAFTSYMFAFWIC